MLLVRERAVQHGYRFTAPPKVFIGQGVARVLVAALAAHEPVPELGFGRRKVDGETSRRAVGRILVFCERLEPPVYPTPRHYETVLTQHQAGRRRVLPDGNGGAAAQRARVGRAHDKPRQGAH
jgi:hypothetical protein